MWLLVVKLRVQALFVAGTGSAIRNAVEGKGWSCVVSVEEEFVDVLVIIVVVMPREEMGDVWRLVLVRENDFGEVNEILLALDLLGE